MGIRKYKPTTPGRRGSSVADFAEITRSTPEKSLIRPLHGKGGRNAHGKITTRHKGGGHKRAYRLIDFRRHDKDGVPAKVAHIEYDPNRSARIALLHYADGEKRYILAPDKIKQGDRIENGPGADIKPGNALPQLLRREDVPLLAVGVVQQRDPRTPVGVVLDVRDLGRHTVLVVPPEVDQPVRALVTATLVPGGDLAVHVPAAPPVQRADQRLLRRRPGDLGEVGDARATTPGRRRLVLANAHLYAVPRRSLSGLGRAAEDLDRLALGGERHDRSLGVLALAVPGAGALALARPVQRVHAHDLDAEHLLDRDLDLGLVGGRCHDERVLVLLEQPVGLLGDHRREQHVAVVGDHLSSSLRCDGGSWKPAFSASSALANQTSASVRL
jgi:hypothetical protein